MKKSEAFPTRFLSAARTSRARPSTVTIQRQEETLEISGRRKESEKNGSCTSSAPERLPAEPHQLGHRRRDLGEDREDELAREGGSRSTRRKCRWAAKMVDAVRIRRPEDDLPMSEGRVAAGTKAFCGGRGSNEHEYLSEPSLYRRRDAANLFKGF